MQSSESGSPADAWVAAPTVPLSLPQHPLKRRIKLLIGNALAALMPQRLARLHAEKRYAGLGAIDQWMLSATAYTALQRGNQELSSQILQGFWQSQQAAEWMQGNARYRELFLPHTRPSSHRSWRRVVLKAAPNSSKSAAGVAMCCATWRQPCRSLRA